MDAAFCVEALQEAWRVITNELQAAGIQISMDGFLLSDYGAL